MARILGKRTRSPGSLLSAAGLILALCMAGYPSAGAQEAAPAAAESGSTPPQAEPSSAQESDRKTPAGGEVFVPTEEISEDYAVSFPVDI